MKDHAVAGAGLRCLRLGLGLALCLWLAAPAAAAPPRAGATKAAPRAPKETKAQKRAQDLIKKGDEARSRSQWALALQLYQQAYDVAHLVPIQRQIGDCHRGMGNAGRAAFAYHQYLKYAGEVADRPEIEELAARMEKLAAETRSGLEADAAPEAAAEAPAAPATPVSPEAGCSGCSKPAGPPAPADAPPSKPKR